MFDYIKNIQFIGDLSLEDADVLAKHAKQATSVLEFGAGGSTQIFCQCANTIISIETESTWIEITQHRISKLVNPSPVIFKSYTTEFDKEFDLIFVDGVDHLRREFAINTWKNLKVGGVMLFHDTRRFQDFQNAAWIAQLYFNEISSIDINAQASNGRSSNITILHKKTLEPYVNWNHTENKPMWTYGIPDGEDHALWTYQ